jgi:uncharacterized membrane protein
MEHLRKALKRTFFAGLVVVVPFVITVLSLLWLFRGLDGFVSPLLYQVLGREIAGLGILTEILFIFLVGLLTTNVFGSRLLNFFQNLLLRLPVAKTIYPPLKQLMEALSPTSGSAFKKVVLVEYPQKGIFTLGFLTSEVSVDYEPGPKRFYSIYLPTNNLYLGQVALFKMDEVIMTDFTIEEGLKIILSGGTAFPPAVKGQKTRFLL